MIRQACLFITLQLALAACGAPTIDTSTDERMNASVDEVRSSLPEKQRAEFDNAFQVVATSQIDFGELFASGKMPDSAAMANDMRAALQGKTGREVIATADRIVQAQKATERERTLQEIAELQKERSAAAAARGELAKFEVLRSRFHTERDLLRNERTADYPSRSKWHRPRRLPCIFRRNDSKSRAVCSLAQRRVQLFSSGWSRTW